jgi:hypothetical protein
MPFAALVLKVLIIPLGPVDAERRMIETSLAEWNAQRGETQQTVVVWKPEQHTRPTPPRVALSSFDTRAVDGFDLLIAVLGADRTQPDALPRTVEEIVGAYRQGLPIYLFVPAQQGAASDDGVGSELRRLGASLLEVGRWRTYTDLEDLGGQIGRVIDDDVHRRGAATSFVGCSGPLSAVLRSEYLVTRATSDQNTGGQVVPASAGRFRLENVGSVMAEDIEIAVSSTSSDAFDFHGPDRPFNLSSQAHREWMLVSSGDIRELMVRCTWHEGEHKHQQDQTVTAQTDYASHV